MTGDARRAIGAAAVVVVALGAVIACVVLVAGRGRDGFGHGSVNQLASALKGQGLTICASTEPETRADDGGALTSQHIDVSFHQSCDEALVVQIDAFEDQSHRDAAARNAEGHSRPRTYGTVYTWKQYAIYLQGDDASRDASVRDRVISALDSVGAD